MRKATTPNWRENKNRTKIQKSMKNSRFNRALFVLFLSLSFFQYGQAQMITDTITCNCSDEGSKVLDSIIITAPTGQTWFITDYSGKTLIPDSTLWHAADESISEGYYLAPDAIYQPLDTLVESPAGSGRYVFYSYRQPNVPFTGITFNNTTGDGPLVASYPLCSPDMGGIMGMDTVCLSPGMSFNYQINGILAANVAGASWSITGDLPTGSGSVFSAGTGANINVNWITPGNFNIAVNGTTTSNCPIDASIDVHVIDTNYEIVGPAFACENGDTTLFSVSADILSTYDTIYWEILDAPGVFVSDSNDVNEVMIAWDMGPATARVVFTAEENSGAMCTVTDTVVVSITDVLGASITGDDLFCIGDIGSFSASVNNLDTILWSMTSTGNSFIGDPRTTAIDIAFNEAGLDTIYIEGVTMMGCAVRDTLIIDVKDSDVMLMGDVDVCLGESVTYSARYSDGSLATFSNLTWEVTPMIGDMDTTLIKSDPSGPFDSLMVNWNTVGNYQIIVNAMTGDNCMLADTIDVSVQDTNYLILGPSMACFLDPAEYVIVQAADSSDAISNPVMWSIMRGQIGGSFTEEVSMMSNDTISHGFFLGTFSDPNVTYMVIASGTSDNGCAFADTMMVDVLGRSDLSIDGPDELCSGARNATYYVNIPDTLFDGTPVWDVRYANGTPLSPGFYTGNNDSLTIEFPSGVDTFDISLSASIMGAACDPMISSKRVIISDTIGFITPAIDTVCLDVDPAVFVLNVDSTNVDAGLVFSLFSASTNAFIQELPRTRSGASIAAAAAFPGAGQYIIRANGYTLEDCVIDEEIMVTVKDTNYIISGDPQVCVGDTMSFEFLQGWDNQPVGDLVNGDSVQWSFAFNGGALFALTGSGSGMTSGAAAFYSAFSAGSSSIDVAFDSIGSYQLFASATTDCGDCDVDAVFDLIVRGSEFALLGPEMICNNTPGVYRIANVDSSAIIDLVADSTTWTLASGLTGQFTGALNADSITINWSRMGVFTSINDTLYFSGQTNDGCVVRDTLPIVINSNDYMLMGDGEVCAGAPIALSLVNEFDSTMVAGVSQLTWIINGTDTVITPSLSTLDRLDMAGTITTWPSGGVYSIQAIGANSSGCLISEMIDITVYDAANIMIQGDLNTCLGTVQNPTDPDVYSLNIDPAQLTSVTWEIIPYGAFPQPDHNGLTGNSLTITQWNSSGHVGPNIADYRIKVTGTTLGDCAYADSVDVIIIPTGEAFSMICNNNLNITLPNSCELLLTPDMILENWEDYNIPADQFEITVKDPETGIMISDQGIVDGSLLGKQVEVEVRHECSGQTCWGYVTLEDKNIPALVCGSDTIACDGVTDPGLMDFSGFRIAGYPVPDTIGATVTPVGGQSNTFIVRGLEKCGDATLTFSDRIEEEICTGNFGTLIYRDWTMTNQSGLSTSCTDTIKIERLHIDTFINMFADLLQDKSFECGENVDGFANPNFDLDEYCFNIQWTSSEVTSNLCNGNDNTYTTTKTWTILDWCSGVVRNLSQTITVDDNTAPTVNLRGNDINTEASEDFCFGIIELDQNDISISDPSLCSDIASVRVRIFEDNPTGQLIKEQSYTGNFTSIIISDPNVLFDLSKIFINVEATDQCGNIGADTISRMVIVDDNIMPTASCDDIITVNLNDEGWGLASYQAFDRGSNDNCGPVDICITRMDDLEIFEELDSDNDDLVPYADFLSALMNDLREGTNYSDKTILFRGEDYLHKDSLCTNRLKFECADAMESFLGNNVFVQMTVTDVNGESSTCTTEVEVRDNGVVEEVVVVTGDIQLDCGSDYSQYVPFDGDQTVRFLTNCGIPIAPNYSIDTSGLSNCGAGVITRTFTATDQAGGVFTHVQTITIGSDSDLINPDNIAGFWPQDFEGAGCPGSAIHPDNLASQYLPNFDPTNYLCSQADLYHTDLVFRNVEGYCAKVLRTWTLVDWCQMSDNDPDAGMWEYVQVFKLTDEDAPIIQASAIEERATSNAGSCSAFVSLEVTADDCHDNEDLTWSYTISNGATGTSNEINTSFEVGTYTINWTVTDPCGNEDMFEQTLVIIDGVPPAMACTNVTMDLGSASSITITADMFAGNTSDGGCSSTGNIEYFFGSVAGQSTMSISCDDLNGTSSADLPLTIVARDEQGNFASCEVIFTLTDSQNTCGNESATAFLSGEIMTELDYTIDNVEVALHNANVAMNSMMTPIEGTFSFTEVPMYDQYEIKANREDDYLNGVTTLDLLLMQRHILGIRLLDSPYKVIAADVDGSLSITGADLVAMRKLILGTTLDFPINRPWSFVDAGQTFENDLNPFPYNQSLILDNLDQDINGLDFIGIKMGDVNENVYLESAALAGARSITQMKVNEKWISNDQVVVSIDPSSEMNFAGIQAALTVNLDYAEVISVKSSSEDFSSEDFAINIDGTVNVSITSPELLKVDKESMGLIEITLKVHKAFDDLASVIAIDNGRLTSELYSYNGVEIEVDEIALEFNEAESFDLFKLNQNTPNPFISETTVEFYNNIEGDVGMKIYDAAGKIVHASSNYYVKGWHKMTVRTDDLEGPGLYIYELNNGTEVVRKKMMALE